MSRSPRWFTIRSNRMNFEKVPAEGNASSHILRDSWRLAVTQGEAPKVADARRSPVR
jgi:hypothetical protein